ncbi:uncharacterized protein P884DRAFT_317519 [Thermothelomyces heterothallicus CBS 202.75]|uniref:uncharacterized protein n=1 Tax=Thermothelomyces heterothallicus CBS 202.75 TaxID=1149848 RepID=UPI003744724B
MSRRRRAIVLDKLASLRSRNERQRKADEDDELFLDAEFDDRREICQKEQEERTRARQSIRLFVKTYKKRDFDQIWLDLCRDDLEVTRPVLGEEEYESVQTITATRSVITH